MGVNEASQLWELSNASVRELCKNGDLVATQIDDTWAILRDQPKESLNRIAAIRQRQSLYYIAVSKPDEKLCNLVRGCTIPLDDPIQSIFINDAGPLSSRATNALLRRDIKTVKDLMESSLNELWPIRNFGERALLHTFICLNEMLEV